MKFESGGFPVVVSFFAEEKMTIDNYEMPYSDYAKLISFGLIQIADIPNDPFVTCTLGG